MPALLAEPPPTALPRTLRDEAPDGEASVRPLTVDEFLAMFDRGILSEEEPVELLDGQIVYRFVEGPVTEGTDANPKPKHVVTNLLAYNLFAQAVEGFDACVLMGGPTRLREGRLPLPDVMIARGDLRDYTDRHPEPADVILCVEVSDTTLNKDTGRKLREYASAGLSTYVVVDLVHERIEVFTDPRDDGTYRSRQTHSPGDDVPLSLRLIGDVVFAVDAVLPG